MPAKSDDLREVARRCVEQQGMTFQSAAEFVGVTAKTVSKWAKDEGWDAKPAAPKKSAEWREARISEANNAGLTAMVIRKEIRTVAKGSDASRLRALTDAYKTMVDTAERLTKSVQESGIDTGTRAGELNRQEKAALIAEKIGGAVDELAARRQERAEQAK